MFSKILKNKGNGTINLNFNFYEEVVDSVVSSERIKNELKIKLKESFENPKLFYNEKNKFKLSELGLVYPNDILLTAKFVLVDTLIANNQMAEVDWKASEDEVRSAINGIISAKRYDIDLEKGNRSAYKINTFEIITSIDNEELKPSGFCLELIDINSDSYVFTIVPLDKCEVIKRMFEKMR